MEAARDLASPPGLNSPALSGLLAEDVQLIINGKIAGSSKAEWFTLARQGVFHDNGQILGVSEA